MDANSALEERFNSYDDHDLESRFNNYSDSDSSQQPVADQRNSYIMQLAKSLQNHPALNKGIQAAAPYAEHFNRAVQGTGLPNASREFFQSGSNLIRGPLNLIPGINIPDPKFNEMNIPEVNPELQRIGDIVGGIAGYAPALAAQKGIQGAQALQKIPAALRGIGAGSTVGAAISPEHRTQGAMIGGLASAPEAIGQTLSKLRPTSPAEAIQSRYDTLSNKLSDMFEHVASEAKSRGISKVPVSKNLLKEIKQSVPNAGKTFKSFVDKAKGGDYNSLRKLQSELWTRGTELQGSALVSERELGREMMGLRKELNDSISNHLKSSGHKDLASTLSTAKKGYENLMEVYHDHPTISALVGKSRKEPESLLKTLQEKSEEMKRVRYYHPEIEKSIKFDRIASKLKKAILGGKSIASLKGLDYIING